VEAFVASARFSGEDLNPVGIAFGLGTCMSVALALLMYDRNIWFRLVNIAMLLILARGLLLTGSRGALLSFICVVLVLGLIRNRFLAAASRARFLLAGAVLIAGALAWLTFSSLGQGQAQFYLNRLEFLGTGRDMAANARMETWQYYDDQFFSWVLLGYRNYAGNYPHNFFYEFWLRFGLVGLGASIFSGWVIVRTFLLMWRQPMPPLAYAMIGVLLFGFINAQTNLALEFNRSFWLGIGFAVTLVVAVPSPLRRESGSPRLPPRATFRR
jgi:O-antigen ligase